MMGGQDQGLYTNYAELMLKNGGLNFVDEFRKELPDSLKEIYDKVKMASVPLIAPDKSIMTVAFYPLHPIWMAVFSWGLGEEFKTLSLLLFSLIYIWSGKLLAEEIFSSERAGTIAAILLAINPALVFFSKYPVTEMVGLAFSLSGFLYLLRGIGTEFKRQKLVYLTLSVLCFVSFFFVRMQFLMYIPFFSILILGLILHDRRSHWRSGAIPTLILICILFVLSLVWYFKFQNDLFSAMIWGHVWGQISGLIPIPLFLGFSVATICFVLVMYLLVRLVVRHEASATSCVLWFHSKSGIWLLLALLVSGMSIMRLYQTGAMSPFPFVLDTSDRLLFRYHALYRYILLFSPFAFIAFIFGVFDKTLKEGLPGLLLLFITTSWLVVLIQPWIPYLYYYGRYLAGELLPYSLIAVAGIFSIWIRQDKRFLAYSVLILTSVYYLTFFLPQFRFIESEPRNAFTEFVNKIHKNDIVLAVGLDDRMLVPLRLSYNKNVFAIKEWDSSTHFVTIDLPRLRSLAFERGGRLLLLAPAELSVRFGSYMGGATFDNSFLTNSEHIREGVIQSPRLWRKLLLPFIRVKRSSIWIFHDITSIDFPTLPYGGMCPDLLDFSELGNLTMSGITLTNFSHQEKNGRWTDGDYSAIECKQRIGSSYKSIVIQAQPYLPNKDSWQRVSVSINDEPVDEFSLAHDKEVIRMSIPLNSNVKENLKIGIHLHNTMSPFDIGESADRRKLGLYVQSISFE